MFFNENQLSINAKNETPPMGFRSRFFLDHVHDIKKYCGIDVETGQNGWEGCICSWTLQKAWEVFVLLVAFVKHVAPPMRFTHFCFAMAMASTKKQNPMSWDIG